MTLVAANNLGHILISNINMIFPKIKIPKSHWKYEQRKTTKNFFLVSYATNHSWKMHGQEQACSTQCQPE